MLNISCPYIGISDHLPTVGVRLYKQPLSAPRSHKFITYRSFKNLNESEFLKSLSETPWDSAFIFENVDDIVNINMPLIKKRVKYDTQPKWLTSELLELIKSRGRKLMKAKCSNLSDDWMDFKGTKNKVTSDIRSAKRKFFHQSFTENGNNPKKLWSIIKHLSGRNTKSNGVAFLEENDKHIRDPSQMAEIFNDHFSNLAKHLIDNNTNAFDPSILSNLECKLNLTTKIVFPEMTTQQILRLIKAFSINKATGIDGLSARLVKIAAPAIAPSLTTLMNTCITTGVFPSAWKVAKIRPFYKSG